MGRRPPLLYEASSLGTGLLIYSYGTNEPRALLPLLDPSPPPTTVADFSLKKQPLPTPIACRRGFGWMKLCCYHVHQFFPRPPLSLPLLPAVPGAGGGGGLACDQ